MDRPLISRSSVSLIFFAVLAAIFVRLPFSPFTSSDTPSSDTSQLIIPSSNTSLSNTSWSYTPRLLKSANIVRSGELLIPSSEEAHFDLVDPRSTEAVRNNIRFSMSVVFQHDFPNVCVVSPLNWNGKVLSEETTDGVVSQMDSCISSNKDLIMVPIKIKAQYPWGTDQFNILFIDGKKATIERFDPTGIRADRRLRFDKLDQELKKLGANQQFTFIEQKDLPVATLMERVFSVSSMISPEYVAYWYYYVRLLNRNMDIDTFNTHLVKRIDVTGKSIQEQILIYNEITQFITDVVHRANITDNVTTKYERPINSEDDVDDEAFMNHGKPLTKHQQSAYMYWKYLEDFAKRLKHQKMIDYAKDEQRLISKDGKTYRW